jgi:GH24 family phage-related lysozyme (muramidase)
MNISPTGIALIKGFESCDLHAYPDPGTGGDPWTIGWGTTRYANGKPVRPGDTVTQAEADALLNNDLVRFERQVTRAIGNAPTSQNQFDALVSFDYNTGELLSSTLLRLHNAGDYAGAAREFGRWVHSDGKVLPGLIHRRAEEANLYEGHTA